MSRLRWLENLSFPVLAARIAGECWVPRSERGSLAARLLRRQDRFGS
jgi:hypothetical protein